MKKTESPKMTSKVVYELILTMGAEIHQWEQNIFSAYYEDTIIKSQICVDIPTAQCPKEQN